MTDNENRTNGADGVRLAAAVLPEQKQFFRTPPRFGREPAAEQSPGGDGVTIHIRPQTRFDCDVLVVGAGPAGASAAYHLARGGLTVIMMDRRVFPRDKTCGDFVSPVSQRELGRIGLDLSGCGAANIIRRASLYLNGEELICQPIPRTAGLPTTGLVVPRFTLDNLIVNAALGAGATFLQGFRFTGYENLDDGVTVSTYGPDGVRELRARLLIGADGCNSTVARLLRGRRPHRGHQTMAIRAYFTGVAGPSDRADLVFTTGGFPGYCWLFPTGRYSANVGVGMATDTVPPPKASLRELLLGLVRSDPVLRRRLCLATMDGVISGWPLASYNPQEQLVGDRVILIGDAAGLVNPLNGEGIQNALLSGRWASEAVTACAGNNDFDAAALSAYSRQVEKELRYDMSLANLVVQLIRNRTLGPVWMRGLRAITDRAKTDAACADIAGGILAGVVPANKAASVRLAGGTLEQAVMSTGMDMVASAIEEPTRLVGIGIEGVEKALGVMSDVTSDPAGFTGWAMSLANAAVEFSGQAVEHGLLGDVWKELRGGRSG